LANAELEIWANFYKAFLPREDIPFEPMLDVYYPIIDDLTPTAVIRNKTSNNATVVVGLLAVPIYWRSFIRNILSEGSNGVVVVVQNPCNEPFTYQINGPNVVYVGVGDKHDQQYDGLEVASSIVDLKSFALRDSRYTGASIDPGFCPYTLHVYPSDTMKSAYVSRDATVFLILVLLIFSFTSCVFLLYDWFVERRQNRVKTVALHSTAIVSSLFPSSVRDRLFPTPNKIEQQKAKRRSSDVGSTDMSASNVDDHTAIIGSPIAQVYPETTVIFADIVGFTAWSSSRDAIQVFHLLETIYAGFDSLAKVRGVFKIETIGDSYVAVVGLPKSRKRHAVVMAKFANDMRAKMKELTNKLEESLGPVR
jgi:Adenylate and Guanylate cyclase catalytic domain